MCGFGWRGLVCASLLFAMAAGAAALAQEARFFRIGTAATAGRFFEIGGVVASAISSPPGSPTCVYGGSCGVPGLLAVAQTTQGSLENLRQINNGQLESGFAQADLAGWAYSGSNIFADAGAMQRLRAIASLFPEALHLVVRAESPIRRVADLRGKTVALGEPGSGTLASTRTLLAAMGLDETTLTRKYLRPALTIDELRAGTIDAFFLIGVGPMAPIRELAGTTPIRLVPIDDEILHALEKAHPVYSRTIIAAGSYRGVEGATVSVGCAALWVAGAGVEADLIYAITKALWNDATERLLSASNPIGARVRREGALTGLSLPLHPGAERYYREAGMPMGDLPRLPDQPREDGRK